MTTAAEVSPTLPQSDPPYEVLLGYPKQHLDKLLFVEFDGQPAVEGCHLEDFTGGSSEVRALVASLLRPGNKHIEIWFKVREGSIPTYQHHCLDAFWNRYSRQQSNIE